MRHAGRGFAIPVRLLSPTLSGEEAPSARHEAAAPRGQGGRIAGTSSTQTAIAARVKGTPTFTKSAKV